MSTLPLDSDSERELRQACAELNRRLRGGEECCAEDLLRDFPIIAEHPEAAVELIYAEFVLREELGQRPDPVQWCARFPKWRDRLQRLFNVHCGLLGEGLTKGATTARSLNVTSSPGDVIPRHPPSEFGDYELLEEIGRGGMGVVYQARQKSLNRVVALKMILSGEYAGAEELDRFRVEAETVAQLGHPNIVQIHEIGEADGRLFLALEFVPGGSLEKKLAGAPLSGRQAALVSQTLARAVQFAHERGIVHRDLKPGNILLVRSEPMQGVPLGHEPAEEYFLLKIADFGLAKRFDRAQGLTQSSRVMG